jgi:RNA 3'-terminal phosphate cyclase (ATP)
MPEPLQVASGASPAVLDGALGLGLATGVPLDIEGPLQGADLEVALGAAQISGVLEAARELENPGIHRLALTQPRPGTHLFDLPAPGGVARALFTLSWPLALAGRPSELRLRGPNHDEGVPTFHDLRLCWSPMAAQFGLKMSLELTEAGFAETGELIAHLDPAPALMPLRAIHRGLLKQVFVVAAVAGGRSDAALEGAQQVVKSLRRRGIVAEAERVPLPIAQTAQGRSRWALTAVAEFESSVVSVSELARWGGEAHDAAERVAERLHRFLQRRGALDANMSERLLLPSFLCAAGLGARAGTAPACHYSTSEVTPALLELATLARKALPVRAVVDGAQGEEGVVVVAQA